MLQVFCSPERRHLIGQEPINHALSRTPPPIQPLSSLFQCVYYTADHRETLVFTCTEPSKKKKNSFSCLCEKTFKRSTCPRERLQQLRELRRRSRRGDRPGYHLGQPHLRQNQRPRRQLRKKRP